LLLVLHFIPVTMQTKGLFSAVQRFLQAAETAKEVFPELLNFAEAKYR